MDKNIVDFSGFVAGWMSMHIWDYRTQEIRTTRVSYIQDFFDDLLMMCKFLLSTITGIYEINIDQEGFDSAIRCYKYQLKPDAQITVELRIPVFEDEEWNVEKELIDNYLIYHNVSIKNFVENIINLVEKYKQEYNEGFVLTPSNRLNEKLLKKVKSTYMYLVKEGKI